MLQVPPTQLAKMSIDLKYSRLTSLKNVYKTIHAFQIQAIHQPLIDHARQA